MTEVKLEMDKILNTFITDDCMNVLPLLPDESCNTVITDPPYNISTKNKIFRDYRSGKHANISMDFGEWDYDFSPMPFLEEAKRILIPGGSLLIFCSRQILPVYEIWCQIHKKEMIIKNVITLIKSNPVPFFRLTNYRSATEFIVWISKGNIKRNNPDFIFHKQEEMKNVFEFPICGGHERTAHPTQKPLALCQELVKRHCRKGGIVLDAFSGSGTIALAAYSLGRNFIAIEKDEKWNKIARQRIKNYQIQKEECSEKFEQIKF